MGKEETAIQCVGSAERTGLAFVKGQWWCGQQLSELLFPGSGRDPVLNISQTYTSS